MPRVDTTLAGPIHHVDHGGAGRPPLVLIHGLGGSHANWVLVAPELARDHHVQAIDLIGHGFTPAAGRRANLAGHRRLIHAFLTEVVGEPAVLVGNSTGGHLAVMQAAAAPETVGGLVLVNPAVPVPYGGPADWLKLVVTGLLFAPGIGELWATPLIGRSDPERAVRRALRACTPHPERIPEAALRANAEVAGRRGAAWAGARAFLQTARSLAWSNARPQRFATWAAAVSAPVLLLHGELDPLVPVRAARALAASHPKWEAEIYPDTGHIPMLEAPEVFLASVRGWLLRHFPPVVSSPQAAAEGAGGIAASGPERLIPEGRG